MVIYNPNCSHAGLRPRLACQFWSQVSSFLALLLSPCWPMICRRFVGLYLSTHSKDSTAVSEIAETSGLCVSCVAWLSCVCGVVVAPLSCIWSFAVLRDNGDAIRDGVSDICKHTITIMTTSSFAWVIIIIEWSWLRWHNVLTDNPKRSIKP